MTTEALNKSDLIERIALKNPHLAEPLVEDAVKIMIDQMIEALSSGDRIEIRGFGSFALHHREPRLGVILKLVNQLMLQQKLYHISNQVKHFVMQ
jgi:integration host factor subunit beta